MPRTMRLPGALRGRGTALALAGAAAAAVASVAGTASAAHIPTAAPHSANLAGGSAAATLTRANAGPTLAGTAQAQLVPQPATAGHPAAPHAIPPRRPVQVALNARHPVAAKPIAFHPGAAGPAHRDAPRHAHAALKRDAPAKPWEIYDSVTPSQIPAHHEVATYADGGFAVSPHEVSGGGHVVWIDTNGSDPKAAALDVEPGDATPQGAATWAREKLTAEPNHPAIIYTMRSEWPATKAAISHLPAHMRSEIRWWIADPTGVRHIVAGADATQWYWGKNYDISTVKPGF